MGTVESERSSRSGQMARDRLELRNITLVLLIGIELVVTTSRHNLCLCPFMLLDSKHYVKEM